MTSSPIPIEDGVLKDVGLGNLWGPGSNGVDLGR